MSKQIAIVTGAGSGIGRAIAIALASDGYQATEMPLAFWNLSNFSDLLLSTRAKESGATYPRCVASR